MNINQELNKLMIEYIKSTGHNKSGALVRSISFDAKIDSQGSLDLGFKANDYILFLDNGKFVDRFFEQNIVKAVIANFITDSLFTS